MRVQLVFCDPRNKPVDIVHFIQLGRETKKRELITKREIWIDLDRKTLFVGESIVDHSEDLTEIIRLNESAETIDVTEPEGTAESGLVRDIISPLFSVEMFEEASLEYINRLTKLFVNELVRDLPGNCEIEELIERIKKNERMDFLFEP